MYVYKNKYIYEEDKNLPKLRPYIGWWCKEPLKRAGTL